MQKLIATMLVVIVVLMGVILVQQHQSGSLPKFDTQYQAVVLSNNQVYFGKLENLNSQYPVLKDVFYILSKVDSEAKQATNVLVRRGKELHGPEFMILNRQNILMIEPVKDDSQLAKMIAEQKKGS